MKELIELARRRCSTIPYRYRVIAVCFDSRGDYLGMASNYYGIKDSKSQNCHAELRALRRWGDKIHKMLLLRFGQGGAIRAIHCCPSCDKVMKKKNIKIILAA